MTSLINHIVEHKSAMSAPLLLTLVGDCCLAGDPHLILLGGIGKVEHDVSAR